MAEAKLVEKFFNEKFSTVDGFLSSLDAVTSDLNSQTDDANLEVSRVRCIMIFTKLTGPKLASASTRGQY